MPTDEPEITCDMAASRRANELADVYECRVRDEAEARCRADNRTTITVADVEHAAASQPQDVAELRETIAKQQVELLERCADLARARETAAAAVESAAKHAAGATELGRRMELLGHEVESIRKNSSAVAQVLREKGETERADLHAAYAGAMERLLARCGGDEQVQAQETAA